MARERDEDFALLIEVLAAFDDETEKSVGLSDRNIGIYHTGRQNRALFVFSKMIAHNMTISGLLHSAITQEPGNRLLDHFSIAALGRVSIEGCIMCAYLSEPKLTEDQWKLRWLILKLHDATNRKRFMYHFAKATGRSETDALTGYEEARTTFVDGIQRIATTLGFDAEGIKKLVDGRVYIDGLRGAIREAGLDMDVYEGTASYLSAFVHSHPVSFMRADTHKISFDEPAGAQLALCAQTLAAVLRYLTPINARIETFCGSASKDSVGEPSWD